MRDEKAIVGFIAACVEPAWKTGFQGSELEKLRKVLVVASQGHGFAASHGFAGSWLRRVNGFAGSGPVSGFRCLLTFLDADRQDDLTQL